MHRLSAPTIALLGDDRGHVSHQELNALVPRLDREFGVRAQWIATDCAVGALACSLQGIEREVVPVAGAPFATWCPDPFSGVHFCSYAPSPAAIEQLERAGVVVSARADDAGAEVLIFPTTSFFVTSMFQPHIGASSGAALHPLIRAFVEAAVVSRRTGPE
jgi:hypothetical protein